MDLVYCNEVLLQYLAIVFDIIYIYTVIDAFGVCHSFNVIHFLYHLRKIVD